LPTGGPYVFGRDTLMLLQGCNGSPDLTKARRISIGKL
jgi:hypothetical protein